MALISYYSLDGNSIDSISAKNGTDTSMSYSNTAGIINQGGSFNGSSSFINTTNFTELNSIQNFSVSAWFQNANYQDASIVTRWDYQTNGNFLINLINGKIYFYIATGLTDSGVNGNIGSSVANLSTWYHVACVFDGTLTGNTNRAKIYINGVQESVTNVGTVPSTTTNATSTLKIGKFGGSLNRFFNGYLDEIYVYNHSLTQADVINLYNSGRSKFLTMF